MSLINCKKPLVVAFEGIDGCGKSLQSNLVSDALSAFNIVNKKVHWQFKIMDYLFDSFSKNNLVTPEVASMGVCASFICKLASEIEIGTDVIISHRYSYSGIIKDIRRGFDKEFSIHNYSLVPEADILFYFQVDPEIALSRILAYRKVSIYETDLLLGSAEENRKNILCYREKKYSDEFMNAKYLEEKTREAELYDGFFKTKSNCVILDATKSPERICELIMAEMKERKLICF